MALTYTSQADYEAYVPGWVTDNGPALVLLLERAERDIDAILGPIPRDRTTGLKVAVSGLSAWEARALSRAVCAQAEYRWSVGEENLVSGRVIGKEKGPDFEVEYAGAGTGGAAGGSLYGPKVAIELEPIAHLRRLLGTIR